MLKKFSLAEGFVYLPQGSDTCPRMTIEAKLLGCKLVLNDYVQHKDEPWFATEDHSITLNYLSGSASRFWSSMEHVFERKLTISGYTTTLECVSRDYPFEQCIHSMLTFCDEVCIVDAGSKDQTLERLAQLAYNISHETAIRFKDSLKDKTTFDFPDSYEGHERQKNIKIRVKKYDSTNPRFAPTVDGMLKAEARSMCTGDFCWQMDVDEIVHENDAKKIVDMCKIVPETINIISLPVIEFWGGPEKVRVDVQPWKWRLSKNKKNITHGIPKELRRYDEDGLLYAAPGTDSCDMIDVNTGSRLPHASFYDENVEAIRRRALSGDRQALEEYERWFNSIVNELPGVYHYSWYDIPRKIKLYKDWFARFWRSLYGLDMSDTAENNVMFDVPWKEVTEDMIKTRGQELKEKTGGWIWHKKWDGSSTPSIRCNRSEPKIMSGYYGKDT
jgi:glycosyltransferase involved in cell wall biosynthesis